MAFEGIAEKLQTVFKKLTNRGKLTEADIKAAMREIKLVLLEALKGGRPGLHILPMLLTHTSDGGFTQEMRRIYGEL